MRTIIVAFLALLCLQTTLSAQVRPPRRMQLSPIDNMPLVPSERIQPGGEPIAKRDAEYRFYLQASVRVLNGNISGSATMCHYDISTKTAYLISCGHLFSGDKAPGRNFPCEVEVYYKNYEKLASPRRFPAEAICYSKDQDISFLQFKPDWEPAVVFPIAPLSYSLQAGERLESTGCDHAQEVASYTVEILDGINDGENLRTVNNSPRPGRSGGGLLSRDGLYVGIVWGTSDFSGSGYGYYVPLRRIHAYARQFKETSWLLDIGKTNLLINSIPTVDLDGRPVEVGSIPSP